MADSLLFLTELMGMKVFDLKGRRIGRVRDAASRRASTRSASTGSWSAATGPG